MKRSLMGKTIKQTFLAVPAAALMLGVSQAQTTVGINFVAQYATYATVGTGYAGYQMTGFPVTTNAFGVAESDWVDTGLLQGFHYNTTATYNYSLNAGAIVVNLSYADMWSSDVGDLDPYPYGQGNYWSTPGSVNPGNDQVTWAIEDTTGWTNTLSGLATTFPHGYVLQLISASGNTGTKLSTSSQPIVTDGATFTNLLSFNIYGASNAYAPGIVGLAATPVLTSDAITMKMGGSACSLAGFILTDKPVVSLPPANSTNFEGSTLVLSAGAIGIPPLSYQWEFNGAPISGATSSSYTNTSLDLTNSGNYNVVVNNLYGTTTSGTAAITVEQAPPSIVTDLPSTTNFLYAGFFEKLSPVVAGSLPLSFQWLQNGMPIAGATNASLIVSNLTLGISGYSLHLSNSLGSTNSATNYMDVVAAPAGAYTRQVGQDSPDSYWPLNETSGSIAYDYAGLSHNGTINSGVTQGVAGPQPPAFTGFGAGNTAYQFDGSSGFVDCGTNASQAGTTDFSIEAWIKTTATTEGMIVGQRDTNAYLGEYMFSVSANGTLAITIYGTGGTYQFDGLSSTTTVNDGNWHYVAFVRSGTTGTLYADGTPVASTNAPVQGLDSSLATFIGVDHRDSVYYFNGEIASVGIYNFALSPSRIQARATVAGIVPSVALVDGVIGGLIQDSKPVGTPHNGRSVGTTWLATSTDGGSYTRTGVEQFVETNNSQITVPPNADFDTTNGTISFWMQYNLPGTFPGPGTGAAMLFDRRTTAGIAVTLSATSGSIQFQQVDDATGAYATTTVGNTYVGDSDWHNVAITYDQSTNGVVSIYVDGVLDVSSVNADPWSWPTNQEIELGRSHDAYWYLYNGQMDDFRIYNKILTPSEITDMATPATSDDLEETNALVLRFNFDSYSTLSGQSIVWPYGTLLSSPVLGPNAVWTPVANAVSPLLLAPTAPSQFYRARMP